MYSYNATKILGIKQLHDLSFQRVVKMLNEHANL